MRWIVLSLLLAGCADGMTADVRYGDGHAPEGGQANRGGAGGSGGAGVDGGDPEAPARVCDAPLESLNGRAYFVSGSVRAIDPAAADPFTPDRTCGDWAASFDESSFSPFVGIANGMIETATVPQPVAMVSAVSTGSGCVYTLRRTTGPSSASWPCAATYDYALTVP